MRIVPLSAPAAEIVCLLGGRDLIVGIVPDHDRSPAFQGPNAPDVLAHPLNAQLLTELRPDLIIAHDLAPDCQQGPSLGGSQVRDLAPPGAGVLILRPDSIESVLDDVLRVGEAMGCSQRAADEVVALRQRLWSAHEGVNPYTRGPVVVMLESLDPPVVCGLWNAQMIERAGGRHPLNPTSDPPEGGLGTGSQAARRLAGPPRTVGIDAIVRAQPEVLVIALRGHTLDASAQQVRCLCAQRWFSALPAVRHDRVAIIDHTATSPGARLIDTFEFLAAFLGDRPESIPGTIAWQGLVP